ncbi:hypothetical protein BGX31_000810, partial [Mortierella sp. GBA43]
LRINIEIRDAGKTDVEEEQLEDNQETEWTSLKELELDAFTEPTGTEEFWNWLWKKCGQVKKLDIMTAGEDDVIQSLARGMLDYMPHLHEIYLRGDQNRITDNEVADLLSGSRAGWRSVEVKGVAMFGRAALDALANSFATLETLHLEGCYIDDIDLAQVLRSCSRLQWVSITNRFVRREAGFPCMNASAFIDRDSDTGTLVTWACEASLKYLGVKLLGIPRPDLVDSSTVESYPGQGREIQSQVYERLGRLINLDTLYLGNEMHYNDDFTDQDDCLEMSLESGLHKLSELKKLRELSVSGMKTKIGVAEVEWMDEQWPSLGMLSGIKDGEVKARAEELYCHRLIRVLEARIQRKLS